jgi:hypothetical protein
MAGVFETTFDRFCWSPEKWYVEVPTFLLVNSYFISVEDNWKES